jgi:hypothetical protein
MSRRPASFSVFALLLAGACACATAEEASVKVLTDPAVAARGGQEGAAVLWGGRIVVRTTETGKTCLEVAAFPLRKGDGRPQTESRREGQHFFACQADAFDATSYAVGNQATVTGTLERIVSVSCHDPSNGRGVLDRGSLRKTTSKGCELSIPSVLVTDSRSWPEPPTRTGAPTM